MDADNRPVWDGQRRGWLESWYCIIHDPASRAGFWLRYTFASPLEGPAFAALWAFEFRPGTPPVAAREVFAEGEFSADPHTFGLRIGRGSLATGLASGRIDEAPCASWNLSYKPSPITYFAAPPLVRAFSRAQFSIPTPRTRFTVTLRIAGRTYALDNAPGCQGHFATPSIGPWTWAHATEFEEGPGFAEAVSPGRGLLASVGVAWDGRVWPGNTLAALPGSGCEGTGWKRTFRAMTVEGPVAWEVESRPEIMVGVEYQDPSGRRQYAYNTLLASSILHLDGKTLHSRGTTVFEITSELPRLDVPISLRAPRAPQPASSHP